MELPTAIGSVIKIDAWVHCPNTDIKDDPKWVALKTEAGWRIACDRNAQYDDEEILEKAKEFFVIYDAGEG